MGNETLPAADPMESLQNTIHDKLGNLAKKLTSKQKEDSEDHKKLQEFSEMEPNKENTNSFIDFTIDLIKKSAFSSELKRSLNETLELAKKGLDVDISNLFEGGRNQELKGLLGTKNEDLTKEDVAKIQFNQEKLQSFIVENKAYLEKGDLSDSGIVELNRNNSIYFAVLAELQAKLSQVDPEIIEEAKGVKLKPVPGRATETGADVQPAVKPEATGVPKATEAEAGTEEVGTETEVVPVVEAGAETEVAETIMSPESEQISNRFENFDKLGTDIKADIDAKMAFLKEKEGDNIHYVKSLIDYLDGGEMNDELSGFIYHAGKKDVFKKLSEDLNKVKKEDRITDKYKKLVEKSAILVLCNEARVKMAQKSEYKDYVDGNGKVDISKMNRDLKKRFGEMKEINTNHGNYAYENTIGVSGDITIPNFVMARMIDGAALTFAFNLLAAFKTGNWDNEYLLLAPLVGYGATKALDNNSLDTFLHPENRNYNQAKMLLRTVNRRKTAELWRDKNEVKMAKMIDWEEIKKDKSKYFSLSEYNKDENKTGILPKDEIKKQRLESQTESWEGNFADKPPLLDESKREEFAELLGDQEQSHAHKDRYDFLKSIADADFKKYGDIDEVASHVSKSLQAYEGWPIPESALK